MQQEFLQKTIVQENAAFSDRPSLKIRLLAFLIIAVSGVVLLAHWPGLSAKALCFDDNQYLTDNILVQNPSWRSARRFLTEIFAPSTVQGYYQPLAMISLMLDYALGGRENNLLPFHLTSLILHIANTALIIVLLYLLFGQPWVAAAAGLLFGVHPMTVEPIPWVGERKTLLAAFFGLWLLVFYVCYARTGRKKFYAAVFAMYLLALMSKPTTTTLPLVLLLMDYWPLRRLRWQTLLEKLPLFALGGVFAIITYVSQNRTAGAAMPAQFGLAHVSLVLCHNIIFYLYKIVWPANLSPHYHFPEPLAMAHPMVLAGVIGTCILIPLLLVSLRWTRALLTGWLIFFMAVLPTMGVVGFTIVIAADKYAYLPSVGLLMVLAALLSSFCKAGHTVIKVALAAIMILASSAVETVITRHYLSYWRDSVSLYSHMLRLSPGAAEVYDSLGNAFQSQGKVDDAINCYRQALRISPGYAKVYYNLALLLQSQNKLDDAVNCYRQAIKFNPDYAKAYYNLGHLLQSQGKLEPAVACYRRAITIKPDFADAHHNLAFILVSQGRLDEAISHYRQALLIRPGDYETYNNLGIAYEAKGDFNQAINYYRNTIRLRPDYAQAYYNLACVLQSQGRLDDAVDYYRRTIRIKPDYEKAFNNLGVALRAQNKLDEAIGCFRQAISIRPDYIEAHNNLAKILLAQGKADEAILSLKTSLEAKRSPAVLSILADVYAAAGQLQQAVATAEKALALASAEKNEKLIPRITQQIERYKQAQNRPLTEK